MIMGCDWRIGITAVEPPVKLQKHIKDLIADRGLQTWWNYMITCRVATLWIKAPGISPARGGGREEQTEQDLSLRTRYSLKLSILSHDITVTSRWVRWRLKSPASPLFTQLSEQFHFPKRCRDSVDSGSSRRQIWHVLTVLLLTSRNQATQSVQAHITLMTFWSNFQTRLRYICASSFSYCIFVRSNKTLHISHQLNRGGTCKISFVIG